MKAIRNDLHWLGIFRTLDSSGKGILSAFYLVVLYKKKKNKKNLYAEEKK